ncbi:hypothetical protein BV898_13434 [Hypsibius exemplaris]|uniref:G-protein coupled receptors family 1 profile domain-containing protein n=1 Tax=Hypsibius exemplaris TaxID=2072580 RepID=A0A1W0WAS8_HYPEX|nr:hypothetical protein BV898_13434 [Hypsibius exemplaris]
MANITNAMSLSLPTISYCIVPKNATISITIPQPPEIQVIIWQYIAGTFCLFGGSTNLVLIIIILRSPQLHRGAGILVSHLLACHVAYFAVLQPFAIARIIAVTHLPRITELDCEFCRFQHLIIMSCVFLVGWTEALLACNRIVGVFFPIKYRLFDRPLVHGCSLTLGWLLTLSLTLPPVFNYHASFKMGPVGNCFYVPESAIAVSWLSFNVYCPLAIATASSVLISVKFALSHVTGRQQVHPPPHAARANNADRMGPRVPSQSGMSRKQARMSRMLITSFLVNFVCQLPQFLFAATGMTSRYPLLSLWAVCCMMLQCSCAPVTFLTLNSDYRKQFAELLPSFLRHRMAGHNLQQPPSGTSTNRRPIE